MFEYGVARKLLWTWSLSSLGALSTLNCDPLPGNGTGGAGNAGAGHAGASAGGAAAGAAGMAGCGALGGAAGASAPGCGAVSVLRVDPNASPGGDGLTWATALSNLQAAIDQLGTRGGGEVWVLGGEFDSLQSEGETLVTLRSDVRIRGGFAGTEASPEQRAAETPRTVLRSLVKGSAATDDDVVLVRATNAHDAELERFTLLEGTPGLRIQDSQGIRIADVIVNSSTPPFEPVVDLVDAEARFVLSQIANLSTGNVMNAANSDLTLVDSSLLNDGVFVLRFFATNSRLLFQRVAIEGVAIHLEASRALVLDSTFRNYTIPLSSGEGILRAWTPDGMPPSVTTMVGSRHLGGHGSGATPITAPDLFVWNSVFARLSGGTVRSSAPNAAVIEAPSLEVALSTFYGNSCTSVDSEGHPRCPRDILTGPSSLVHDTLFVFAPSEERVAVVGTTSVVGSCTSNALDDFQFTADAEPVAVEHPCPNSGDLATLEAARQRLFARAEPFLEAPFFADLSRYRLPNWWREDSATLGQCTDLDLPDPGRHLDLLCPARSLR